MNSQLTTEALWHFTASRLVFLISFVIGTCLLPPSDVPSQANRTQPVTVPSTRALLSIVESNAVEYGDYGWYESVAKHGYDKAQFVAGAPGQHNWCFFPAQAWLIKVVTLRWLRFAVPMLLGLAASLMMSAYLNATFGLACARRAMAFMLYFPFSFELTQFRPEALLFFCFALALWLRHYGGAFKAIAALPLLLAGFCKPNGFLIAIFWLPDLFQGNRVNWRSLRNVATAAPPAAGFAGVVIMSLWMYRLTGAPLAWAQEQYAWGGEFGTRPLEGIQELLSQPMLIGRWGWDPTLENWVVFASVVASAILLATRRRMTHVVFLLASSLLSFTTFGVWVQGKHMAVIFSLFAGIAQARFSEIAVTSIIAVLAMLLTISGFLAGAGVHAFLG